MVMVCTLKANSGRLNAACGVPLSHTNSCSEVTLHQPVKLWVGIKGTFITTFRGHVRPVYQVSWSSDSRLVVSGSSDSTLKVPFHAI